MGEYGKESIADRLCGRFPVHFACLNGDPTTLSQLLSSGKFDLYEEDCFRGWTPAHYAAQCGQLDCLMQLQGVGVNLNVATQQQHQTPLHVAAEAGHSACLTFLLQQGVSIDIQDIHGETAAHKAARQGHVECLQLLRTQGGCFKFPFSVCNYEGKTAGELYQPIGQSEMVCDATTDVQPTNQYSRKRGQMNDEPSTTKRAKFDVSETVMAGEPSLPPGDVPSSTQDYPMDFNEETVPREYARPSLMTSGEIGLYTQACQISPESSSSSSNTSLACQKGRHEEGLHDSLLENNNNSILHPPSQQQQQHQGMLAPSSVVEYQAALHAQRSYEKLCGSACETQCYGHFF